MVYLLRRDYIYLVQKKRGFVEEFLYINKNICIDTFIYGMFYRI